jgi:hypothetical protein
MRIKLMASMMALGFVCLSASGSYAWTVRNTKDGGPNGYNSTSKVVDNDGNTTIGCAGAGNDQCPNSVAKPGDQRGINHALIAIGSGSLAGTWIDPIGGITTTWSATSSAGTDSNIAVSGD